MKSLARIFFALWYLFGWMVHVYLALKSPDAYQPFGSTALFPRFRLLWRRVIMPHIRILALCLAAFELVTGLLLINKGQWVKLGLALSISFNLFLVQLSLAWPAASPFKDFLINRLPNLLLAAAQLPLLSIPFEQSIPEIIRDRYRT